MGEWHSDVSLKIETLSRVIWGSLTLFRIWHGMRYSVTERMIRQIGILNIHLGVRVLLMVFFRCSTWWTELQLTCSNYSVHSSRLIFQLTIFFNPVCFFEIVSRIFLLGICTVIQLSYIFIGFCWINNMINIWLSHSGGSMALCLSHSCWCNQFLSFPLEMQFNLHTLVVHL